MGLHLRIFGKLLLWGLRNVKVGRGSFPHEQSFLSLSLSVSLCLSVSLFMYIYISILCVCAYVYEWCLESSRMNREDWDSTHEKCKGMSGFRKTSRQGKHPAILLHQPFSISLVYLLPVGWPRARTIPKLSRNTDVTMSCHQESNPLSEVLRNNHSKPLLISTVLPLVSS